MHGGSVCVCMCACLSAPAFWLLVGQRWGRVCRLTAVTKQKRVWHRTSCAPSLWVGRKWEHFSYALIFSKLIVWTPCNGPKKKSEDRSASLLVFVCQCNDRLLCPVLVFSVICHEKAEISKLSAGELPPNAVCAADHVRLYLTCSVLYVVYCSCLSGKQQGVSPGVMSSWLTLTTVARIDCVVGLWGSTTSSQL